MRFLIDEDLPRATSELLRNYGHEAIDVRDIILKGAKDSEIASYAAMLTSRIPRRYPTYGDFTRPL